MSTSTSYSALQDYVSASDRHNRDTTRKSAQSQGVVNALDPIADPYLTGLQFLTDLTQRSTVRFGRIQEAIPYVNSYRVAPEGGGSVIQCCRLSSLPASPLSVADHNTLHVGTNVFYLRHPTARYGIILGAEPPYMTDSRKARSDAGSQGSRCGIDADLYWRNLWQVGGPGTNAGIIDWSARQPTDSVPLGEYCKTAMTGIQLLIDNTKAQMRVDEMCGIWMFYWDSLLRIAGQNFQRWTSASALEIMDDEGEHFWRHGLATFPWENWGIMQPPTGTSSQLVERSAAICQKQLPEYAHIEPAYDDLQAFHRVQEWHGYLGQGGKKLISLPHPTENYNYYQAETDFVGMLEENRALSGHLATRTARGLTIGRRPIIPVPKQIRELADTSGDSPDNYRTSGNYGGGLPHVLKVEPDLHAPVGQERLSRIAGLQDWHANIFNWECAHPFHYHDKDYHYPEEAALAASSGIGSNQYIPEWTELKNDSGWYLGEPPKTTNKVKVDHRYEDYIYKVSQHLTFTEDGSIVLGDGSGSEIRMTGGEIFLQCAGDVFVEAGRNFMAWAGRDAVIRAYQSADISATTNDVRIKAEHNVQIIAANDGGPYGLLLECRASSTSYDFSASGQSAKSCGIIMHAPCAEILGLADNIYLRTGVPSEKSGGVAGGTPPAHGDIVIDAVGGRRNFSVLAHTVTHYVDCGVAHVFGTDGSSDSVTAFMPGGANIAGSVYIDGALANAGPHILSGVVAAGQSVAPGHTHQLALRTWADGKFAADITSMWYAVGRPGNADMLKGLWGSLRTSEDYRSNGFVLYETRWAQMGRIEGNIPEHWAELAVTDGNGDTFPFPGKEQFQDKQIYYTQDTKLYDIETGLSKDRGALFEAASYETPQEKQLNCNYPIIGP
jgi:hypothetical protein